MCGISAYRGNRNAATVLVEALRMLEYRGYDSAGVATLHNSKVHIRKGVGKVNEVCASHGLELLEGPIGIAHTRWATTGAVVEKNAHPHTSPSGRFVVVHNGIIENDVELRHDLSKRHDFLSDTDTEIIAHLMDEHALQSPQENNEGSENSLLSMVSAMAKTLRLLSGRNSFVVLDANTQCLLASKNGSPLLFSIADHGVIIASDSAPLRSHANSMIALEDGDILIIDEKGVIHLFDSNTLLPIKRKDILMDWSAQSAEKGQYDHYMLKEIFDQKASLFSCLEQDPVAFSSAVALIKESSNIVFVGCGTTGSVAMAGVHLFATIASIPSRYVVGSEFSTVVPGISQDTVIVAISQSGETADTIEAIEIARSKGAKIIALVNVEGSTIARSADIFFPVKAGPERSVCSTKATTGQMAIIALLAYAINGMMAQGRRLLARVAQEIADGLDEWFMQASDIARIFLDGGSLYLIGRGSLHAIAHEGAIKFQEVAYIHAQGFAGGELKHGPLALITNGTPCIVLVQNDAQKEAVIANALEAKLRGAKIIAISSQSHPGFDAWMRIPDVDEATMILALVPIQLLAYALALIRGNDIDMPRNLAKSVTVK